MYKFKLKINNSVKNVFVFIFASFIMADHVNGQASILSRAEELQIFNDSVKNKFGIEFNIFRVYTYADTEGKFYIALTEKTDSITKEDDSLHSKIRAIKFISGRNGLEKQWEINDFILEENHEFSIWFWTKYCQFNDIDSDGIIDPVLVYGSIGLNDFSDGRIKILLFYKGQKVAIRHQNSDMDFGRSTEIDSLFYTLDASIQKQIIAIIQQLIDNHLAIFPYGWQYAMKKQKLKFDERR